MISAARRFVVVAETAKKVERLGEGFRLPVEVVRFGWRDTRRRLCALLPDPELRTENGPDPYVTDEGHYILDAHIPPAPSRPPSPTPSSTYRASWNTASSSTWPTWPSWAARTAPSSASSAPVDSGPPQADIGHAVARSGPSKRAGGASVVAATSVILALAGGGAFASDGSVESASDAAERKTCKRGQLTLRVRGGARPSARRPARRLCQKLPRIGSSPATRTRAATAVLQSNALAARNRGLRRVLSRKRVRRHAARLAQRVTRRMTVPAASGGAAPERDQHGGDGQRRRSREPGSDELGRGVDSEDSATQGGVTATVRIKDQLFVNRCPDSNGDVPGEVDRLYAMSLSSMVDGRRASLETELSWTGKLEAHVGDDAALRDFDLRIAGTGGASENSGAGQGVPVQHRAAGDRSEGPQQASGGQRRRAESPRAGT